MTPEREIEVARKTQKGDAKAREQMINSNLRLVVTIAHEYTHLGLPLLDLISEVNIGLTKAIERFDLKKGAKLSELDENAPTPFELLPDKNLLGEVDGLLDLLDKRAGRLSRSNLANW